jgi:hypothetical protein
MLEDRSVLTVPTGDCHTYMSPVHIDHLGSGQQPALRLTHTALNRIVRRQNDTPR